MRFPRLVIFLALFVTFVLIPRFPVSQVTEWLAFTTALGAVALYLLRLAMKGASWSRFVLFLCSLFVPIQVSAQDEIIIEGAHYPEGLFWDQRTSTLYYAEMPRDRIMRHVSGAPSVFFAHKGCGPTGIAPIGDQWAIACHIGRSLVIADQEGRFVREIKSDGEGRALQNPNDIVSDGTGVYLSDSGTLQPEGASERSHLLLAAWARYGTPPERPALCERRDD